MDLRRIFPQFWENIDRVLNNLSRCLRIGSHFQNEHCLESDFFQFSVRGLLLHLQIKHVSGPRKLKPNANDIVVSCVVRNGSIHIDDFVSHHRKLGVHYFVFLDNDSTDDTLKRLSSYSNITVLHSSAPYSIYQNTFKRFLAERFCAGCWNLIVDIDERWDYPLSHLINVDNFIAYCEFYGYTVVVCQILDMFSTEPLSRLIDEPYKSIMSTYKYYDLHDLEKKVYFETPWIPFHLGGVRKRLFSRRVGLTKAALVKINGVTRTFIHWHHTERGVIADITCVLKHYPFTSTFAAKVSEAAASGRYGPFVSDEYSAYKRELSDKLVFAGPHSQLLSDLSQLVDQGFLTVSPQYEGWVSTRAII